MITSKESETKTKIILIGRNPDIRLFTALQWEGYEAIASESPEKAWPLVYAFQPHLIILHLCQPSESDIAILHECRAMAPDIPIVVASSVTAQEAVTMFLEQGATSFLALPIERGKIKIKTVIDGLVASPSINGKQGTS